MSNFEPYGVLEGLVKFLVLIIVIYVEVKSRKIFEVLYAHIQCEKFTFI